MISSGFVDGILDRERARDSEIRALRRELAELKAPPTLTIIRHDDEGPHPRMVQMLFQWQGYAHRTMVPREIYDSEPEYREYSLRSGVEATVRAHAEALLPSLVVTEETYPEHYYRVRS